MLFSKRQLMQPVWEKAQFRDRWLVRGLFPVWANFDDDGTEFRLMTSRVAASGPRKETW